MVATAAVFEDELWSLKYIFNIDSESMHLKIWNFPDL